MGVSTDCPKFFGVPLLFQERVELRTSNFVGTFIGLIRTKAHKNVGNSSCGHSQGVPNSFRASMYRAHCAVIFAIAQLSCYVLLLVLLFVLNDYIVCLVSSSKAHSTW